MLNESDLVAFVGVTDLDRATHFYSDTLGLPVTEVTPHACVVSAHGTAVRLTPVQFKPEIGYTVLGWSVADIGETTASLAARGVEFARYEEVEQDANGVWTTPTGEKVAWFQDPDGNILSITQFT